jgi:hypothetical protein
MFLSLLGHLQTFLYSPIASDFRKFFVCGYYYSVYPCTSETLRGSNCCVVFLITLFYTLSLCDKKGE